MVENEEPRPARSYSARVTILVPHQGETQALDFWRKVMPIIWRERKKRRIF